MKLIFKIAFLMLFISIFASNAQGVFTEDVVKTNARSTKIQVSEGEEFQVQVDLSLLDYWYTYSTEMQLNDEGIGPSETSFMFLPDGLIEMVGDPIAPDPMEKFDDGFEMDLKYYDGDISFVLNAKALKDLDFSKDSAFVEVYIQVCDTVRCLPPSPLMISISDIVVSKPAALLVASEIGKKVKEGDNRNDGKAITGSQKEIEKARSEGLWSFFLLSMLAGLGALGTPCVYPMIPITVSFFTKRSEKANAKSVFDAVLFMLGIISTFTIIGLVITAIKGASGVSDIATDPFANIMVAVIFLILAFNLFGAYEIQMPTGMMNFLNKKSSSGGRLGIIIMGIVFSFTSFTCTVPFVAAALQASAGSGDLIGPIVGMVGFSFVFSLPFFLLALFPTLIKKLPKSGGWMNNLKVTLGFLELAAAIKFLSNMDLAWGLEILTRDVFLSLWVGCGILIVLYLLGTYKMKLDTPLESVGAIRAVVVVFFASVTVYLFTGLFGKNLGEIDAYLPPQEYGNAGQSASIFAPIQSSGREVVWMKDYEKAVAKAKSEDKPLFIDFTGWQCTNCRWMEKNRFTDPEIAGLLSEMITVKLYTDRREEPELSNKKLQIDRFNSIELPLYVLQDPNENTIGTKVFTRDREEFVEFLKSAN